jgi:hypothetical protein
MSVLLIREFTDSGSGSSILAEYLPTRIRIQCFGSDPDWIRIQRVKNDPQKQKKVKKLRASPVAWTSFMEA